MTQDYYSYLIHLSLSSRVYLQPYSYTTKPANQALQDRLKITSWNRLETNFAGQWIPRSSVEDLWFNDKTHFI